MKIPPRTNTRKAGGATAKLRTLKSGEAQRVKIAGELASINTLAHRILGKGNYAIREAFMLGTPIGYHVYIKPAKGKK